MRRRNKYIWEKENPRVKVLMNYVLIKKDLRGCLREVNMLGGVTGDERFYHYFRDVNVNVCYRWRVKECSKKMKVIKVMELEKEERQECRGELRSDFGQLDQLFCIGYLCCFGNSGHFDYSGQIFWKHPGRCASSYMMPWRVAFMSMYIIITIHQTNR